MSDLIRVNITLNPDVKKWYEETAKNTGITMSGLMAIALANYMDSKKVLAETGNIAKLVEQLEKVLESQNYG